MCRRGQGVQGTAPGAPLGCGSILILSGEGAPSPLFWVTLPEPKVGRAPEPQVPPPAARPVPSPLRMSAPCPISQTEEAPIPRTIPAERHRHGNPQPCACRPAIGGDDNTFRNIVFTDDK